MKVLLINGSPNARGCTYTALSEVASTLEKEGVETEILHVGQKDIRGCIGCRKCKQTGKCVFDDIVNETAQKFEVADGIVIGSPVYFASANSTVISFITRLFYSTQFDKSMKVGAAVVSCRRGGASATFDEQDLEGMQVMRTLGRNMAFLVKSIALGRAQYGLPEKEPRVATNFIR